MKIIINYTYKIYLFESLGLFLVLPWSVLSEGDALAGEAEKYNEITYIS